MKKYLVTGGCGFIGSNFIKYMLEKYPDIFIVNLDICSYAGNLENLADNEKDSRYIFVRGDIVDSELVKGLFEKYDFTNVINFAAESHVDRSIKNPELFVKTNVLGTVNLLQRAKEHWLIGDDEYRSGVKFLQVSTDEVYGSLGEAGLFSETTPLDPHSPYSASKTSADLFVKAFFDTYKFPCNITRCSNNYGPYQFPEKLIPLVYNNACNLKSLPIYGTGLQIRDWLYVLDHCRAIDLVCEKGKLGEIYNVGGNNERTNLFIVKSIIEYVNKNVNSSCTEKLIKHVEDRKGHDLRYGIDASKIKKELGWEPETPFEEGIVKTLDWYKNNTTWLEHVTSGEYKNYYKNMYGDCDE